MSQTPLQIGDLPHVPSFLTPRLDYCNNRPCPAGPSRPSTAAGVGVLHYKPDPVPVRLSVAPTLREVLHVDV